jgi:type IX secretion system PorP/SprF family membrane protein
MKTFLFSIFCLSFSNFYAQQFPQYTQFVFNSIGYNPAASGISSRTPYELCFGARTQYVGLTNNPTAVFASFNYNFVPKRSYSKWHNVGVYLHQDRNGVFAHNDLWLSYTLHLLVSKKSVLSFGVFAGIKQYRFNSSTLNRNDPAVANSERSTIAWPDIVPGIRYGNKKQFIGLSLQQITIFSQNGIGGKIGAPAKVQPHYIFCVGKRGAYNRFNSLLIAFNLHGSFKGVPVPELTLLNYFNRKFAYGLSVRSRDFACGILQFKLLQNLNVGLAYDLSINKMFQGAPNTAEVMIKISPNFGDEDNSVRMGGRGVSDCGF